MKKLEIYYRDDVDLKRQLRKELLDLEEWMTPKQLHVRYGITSPTLTMRLQRWESGGIVEIEAKRGATGRIRMLKLTPELRALMEGLR